MIPLIGLIVGLYVEVRMVVLLAHPEHVLVKAVAVTNMIVTAFLLMALLLAPNTVPALR